MFWEISDILWKCFGFHGLAKLAEIIKTCGKNQCFWRSLTTYGRALKSQVGRSHQKNKKKRRKLWKNIVFLPCCSVPVIYLFLYLYIYLQSPAVILSSDPPQPIDLLSAYLFIYVCIYTYAIICMYWFLDLYIYLQLPAVILSSDPPQPIDLLSAYLFIYMYIYIYICIYFYIYIFTCNHLQSF